MLKLNHSDFLTQIECIEKTLLASGLLSKGKKLEDFMHTNRLADKGESVFDVFSRTTCFLAKAGQSFYGFEEIEKHQKIFFNHISNFEIILGSPILTNAGRRAKKSISACSIPPVKLSEMDLDQISRIVSDYHTRGMGTGFCLDDLEDPVKMVKYLNHLAIEEVQRGDIERSVGNMGVLSIHHPKVLEFIRVKTDNPEIKEWKFNLSVNLTNAFMEAWKRGESFTLSDGSITDAKMLMRQIADSAHASGDPGVIFMGKVNELNRVPQMGSYKAVVPCGEVSLFEGEVCQFAYLNIIRFIDPTKSYGLDREALKKAIQSAVLLLDNAVESNIQCMPNEQSAEIISNLRRIGIGLCGFSEFLQLLGVPYDSEEGLLCASNLMSFINLESKRASVALAKERGAFKLFHHEKTLKSLFLAPFKEYPTALAPLEEWKEVENAFFTFGIRNLSTTILPPSGRSSIIAGVTASIEPPFRLMATPLLEASLKNQCEKYGYSGDLEAVLDIVKKQGSLQNSDLPPEIKAIFKTASEISPEGHIKMTAAFQQYIDEGISKTVNLQHEASIEEVEKIYGLAYELNLKGLTIYRDGCRIFQPKALSSHSTELQLIDPIYGPVKVSARIAALLESPLLQRLKGLHQNGIAYLIDSRQATSRYEHSVGAMILAKKLGGDESVQIAALLHDISHTAFSHIADLIFENPQQSYHDDLREDFLQTPLAKETIAAFQITEKELACDKIPMIKGKGINVDRLDYCIRDLWKVGGIYHPEYSSILNNLVLNQDGEIVCKDIHTARLIFNKFIQVNKDVYFNPQIEAAGMVLSHILREMLNSQEISTADLFSTDELLIRKIQSSRFRSVFEGIGPSMPFEVRETSCKGYKPLHRKLRYLDPQVKGFEGVLTTFCEESKRILDTYLKTPCCSYFSLNSKN